MLFYFMYTAKISENARLASENRTLTQTIEIQKKVAELKDSLIEAQEKLLVNNREQLRVKQLELSEIENRIENRPDANAEASPYLKELFRELGKTK